MQPATPEEAERLFDLEARLKVARESGAGPLFAHFRIFTHGRQSDLYLGQQTRLGGGPTVLDWRMSPLTEVFFAADEGEDYELDLTDRVVSGKLLEKHLFGLDGDKLRWAEFRGVRYERAPDGDGFVVAPSPFAVAIPPRREKSAFRSPLEVKLDPAQRAVVDLPPDQSILLLGEAGFGKTTVALLRLAALADRLGTHFRGLVIVPTEGLRRLTSLVLERRGVPNVDVFTYDRWAAKLARRFFQDLPPRESELHNGAISKLKRHTALLPALDLYIKDKPRPAEDEDKDARRPGGRPQRASRHDLFQLFGDRLRMAEVVAQSGGVLFPKVVGELAEHTRVQFLDSTESDYAGGHDAERLKTADGARIDEGTPTGDADSVDAEDYAVLFELERLRAVARGQPPLELSMYDCVVVDEAQEFAPLELRLLGRTVARRGTVVIAGDAAQQVDPTNHFAGWGQVLAFAGAPQATQTRLQVNYRCPPEVTALARSVARLAELPSVDGPAIRRAPFENTFHLLRYLTEALANLQREDPAASLALVCRTPESARTTRRLLSYGLSAHLALDGDFHFRPGVLVTSVADVKGLEFDYVVLPDADDRTYPDTTESRRALYVAMTRATHRLVLGAAGRFSPLLP